MNWYELYIALVLAMITNQIIAWIIVQAWLHNWFTKENDSD